MLYMEWLDGLGNQLFAYAFLRALQIETGEPIVVYGYDREKESLAGISLEDALPPDANVIYVDKAPRQNYWSVAPVQTFLCRALRKAWVTVHPAKSNYQIEEALQPRWNALGVCMVASGYIPVYRRKRFQTFLSKGYFQSPKFWDGHDEQICRELRRPELISPNSRDALLKIRSCNSVCVHMRFGDYVDDPDARRALYVCDASYYQRAVELACSELTDPVFFLFTTDEARAAEIAFPKEAKLVRMPQGSAVSDMQMMAQCKHFIIPNSTYSWWAQHLSDNPDKRVYAPERWRRDNVPAALYENGWIKIPVTLPEE